MIALSLLVGLMLYSLFAWFAIRAVGRVARFCAFTVTTKRVLQIICALVFVLVPTWDILPGRLYFKHLCEQKAGVKIFKIVELDKSHFKPNGKPDDKQLLGQYAQFSKHDPKFSSWAHITKIEGAIQNRQTKELLGTITDFVYYGGWLGSRIDPMSPVTCPAYREGIFEIALHQVFKSNQPVLREGN